MSLAHTSSSDVCIRLPICMLPAHKPFKSKRQHPFLGSIYYILSPYIFELLALRDRERERGKRSKKTKEAMCLLLLWILFHVTYKQSINNILKSEKVIMSHSIENFENKLSHRVKVKAITSSKLQVSGVKHTTKQTK